MSEQPQAILGRAHCYGNNVDTDAIIPGKFMNSTRIEDMLPHTMEGIDPEFIKKVQPGDLMIAGSNFGCGSSREAAPALLRACGIRAIVAESFARIFFRNAINLGLLVVECPGIAAAVSAGDQVKYDPVSGAVENITRPWRGQGTVLPDFLRDILASGGAIAGYRARAGNQAR